MVTKAKRRQRRLRKTRSKISGSKVVPRLSVFRSNKAIYAQLIDDQKQVTLTAASSKQIKPKKGEKLTKTAIAGQVGQLIAQHAAKLKVKRVVFDRRFYRYHGRIKALAEGAREGGLVF